MVPARSNFSKEELLSHFIKGMRFIGIQLEEDMEEKELFRVELFPPKEEFTPPTVKINEFTIVRKPIQSILSTQMTKSN